MEPPESTQGGQKQFGYITRGGKKEQPLATRVRRLGKRLFLGEKSKNH
jgi:hypothetical protein